MPTFDLATGAGTGGFGNSLSWSHTVGSGSNRVLIVAVSFLSTTGTLDVPTYGGASMTLLTSVSSGTRILTLYYLKNPTSGTATVSTHITGGGGNFSGTSTSLSDTDQSTPFGTPTSAVPTGVSTVSTTLSAVATDMVLSFLFSAAASDSTAGAGQTIQADAVASSVRDIVTTQAGGTSVSSSFSWTGGTDNPVQITVAAHAVAAAAAASRPGITVRSQSVMRAAVI